MDVIHSVPELRERLRREPDNVFVPTMGNLHDGHIQLMRIAKARVAWTVGWPRKCWLSLIGLTISRTLTRS